MAHFIYIFLADESNISYFKFKQSKKKVHRYKKIKSDTTDAQHFNVHLYSHQ